MVEKTVVLGACAHVPARLIAVRVPEAIVNERRRHAQAVAKKRGSTPSQAHLTLMAWNLFITNVPTTVWPPKTVGIAYSLRWQVELVFRAWKSGLHLATVTPTTRNAGGSSHGSGTTDANRRNDPHWRAGRLCGMCLWLRIAARAPVFC